jgi:hypothetical protein
MLDFTMTGDIGDTIGGTTAPIIGLLSAALIYLYLNRKLRLILFRLKYRERK